MNIHKCRRKSMKTTCKLKCAQSIDASIQYISECKLRLSKLLCFCVFLSESILKMKLQLENEKQHRKDFQAKGNRDREKKGKRRTNENKTTDTQV